MSSYLSLQFRSDSSSIDFNNAVAFFTIYRYITNSQLNQLSDGLIAQLLEHCTSITKFMGSKPIHFFQALI